MEGGGRNGEQSSGPSISIVIPSWNGLRHLTENLPSVIAAARRYELHSGSSTELIISDDGSTDETAEMLRRDFPQIRIVSSPVNRGFAGACNRGFRVCRFPVIALLNNDVELHSDYLIHKAPHFSDPDVFAVTAKVFEWNARVFATGGRFGRFRRGFWSVYFNFDVDQGQGEDWILGRRLLSFYAIGGFVTLDRAKLEKLGGFNELLSPFHWEDVDLSYRAWKRGWTVRYEPRSIARHRTSATIDANYGRHYVDSVSLRNRLLFHWVNLHSPAYLAGHLGMLLLLLVTRWIVLDSGFYRSVASAFSKMDEVRRLRAKERLLARRTDREVRRILRNFYREAPIHVYYNQREVIERHPESR